MCFCGDDAPLLPLCPCCSCPAARARLTAGVLLKEGGQPLRVQQLVLQLLGSRLQGEVRRDEAGCGLASAMRLCGTQTNAG